MTTLSNKWMHIWCTHPWLNCRLSSWYLAVQDILWSVSFANRLKQYVSWVRLIYATKIAFLFDCLSIFVHYTISKLMYFINAFLLIFGFMCTLIKDWYYFAIFRGRGWSLFRKLILPMLALFCFSKNRFTIYCVNICY